jgi:hypothetical protein
MMCHDLKHIDYRHTVPSAVSREKKLSYSLPV